MKLKRSRSNAGFTLIEVLVGIVIIAAASVTMFYGAAIARGQMRQIVLKQRALEELSNYMDYWIARVNYSNGGANLTNHELAGDQVGETVLLHYPWQDITKGSPEEFIEATIYREPLRRSYNLDFSPQQQPYVVIEAYIVWQDPTTIDQNLMDTLRFQTATFDFTQ